ncbi:MAG TPA: hypothetical protein VFQ53_36715 [Kofleriaceae bacterium]|nr:hypothetical protein [Kofleriaceae bacterium]
MQKTLIEPARPMSCSICDQIPPSSRSDHRTKLPVAASQLKAGLNPAEPLTGPCTMVDLRECLECGRWYLWTEHIGLDEYMWGNDGDETLDRLTREQSDVVHAMLSCRADPATIEDGWFALPALAFDEILHAAYRKDRDFVALFIPRLVHAYATRSHSTGLVLRSLVDDTPSYAREVLAATTSLPPELRDKAANLEQHCRDAIAKLDPP